MPHSDRGGGTMKITWILTILSTAAASTTALANLDCHYRFKNIAGAQVCQLFISQSGTSNEATILNFDFDESACESFCHKASQTDLKDTLISAAKLTYAEIKASESEEDLVKAAAKHFEDHHCEYRGKWN
jgi:hypothetical protein